MAAALGGLLSGVPAAEVLASAGQPASEFAASGQPAIETAARDLSGQSAPVDSAAAQTLLAPLRIGWIQLVTNDIFSPEELAATQMPLRFLHQAMNSLHTTTRPEVIRRELLFHSGDLYNPALLAETERNLREAGYLTNVSVVPVDTLRDRTVNVRVNTQETWSLRAEVSYSRASASTERWSVLLSEANFLGQGVQLTIGAGQDEDRRYQTLAFRNQRLFGSPWQVAFSYSDLSDGNLLLGSAGRPFHSQADPWSVSASFWRKSYDARLYLSNAGPAGNDPGRAASLYVKVPEREQGVQLEALRRVSPPLRGRVVRLGGGMEWSDVDFALDGRSFTASDDRVVDLGFLTGPGSPLARKGATVSGPYLALQTEGRHWSTGRYLIRYGRVEDVPLDPFLELRTGWSRGAWGGAAPDRLFGELKGGDWSRLSSGLLVFNGEANFSAGGGEGDRADVDLVAGWLGRQTESLLTRLFAEGAWGGGLAGSDAFVLGLGRGLRTLEFDGMAGDRLARWSAEENLLLPFEALGFYKVGVAAYYAGGAAWWRDEARGLGSARHEVGVGLRFGSSRSARADLARVDLSWPLNSGGGPVVTAVTGGWF